MNQNHHQFSEGTNIIDVNFFLINIHQFKGFQWTEINWNVLLESYDTDVWFDDDCG